MEVPEHAAQAPIYYFSYYEDYNKWGWVERRSSNYKLGLALTRPCLA